MSFRVPAGIVFAAFLLLSGCGYPADPLPPALNRPTRVTDLSAVERGDRIVVTWTQPKRTTEDLEIKGGGEPDLRIGPMPDSGFDVNEWARTAERVSGKEIAASKFYGKNVVLALQVKGARGQTAGWSNFVTLSIVPALQTPQGLALKNAPDAVSLEWHGTAPEYRVFRRVAGEKEWTLLTTAKTTAYTDAGIEYGKTYEYYVQAVEGQAESEVSQTEQIAPVDTFAPAVPSGITVAPGIRTIELLWDRNTEKDFSSYTVYRDGMKLAGDVKTAAYTDRDVRQGVRYSYQLSATDTKGNESARSAAFEATIP